MGDWAALRLALDLHQVPWRVRLVREQPLPAGMLALLNVAAGEVDAEAAAAERLGRPGEAVRQAATFFIEQILLAPGADSYRVLGAGPAATSAELRRNMALLMRWLHPDVAREGEQAVFAARIAEAWNALKTPERRTAYDQERRGWLNNLANEVEWAGPAFEDATGEAAGIIRRASPYPEAGPRRRRLPRLLAFWLLGRQRY